MADGGDYLTLDQAAALLGKSERTVRRLIERGKLTRHFDFGTTGKVIKVLRADVDRLPTLSGQTAEGRHDAEPRQTADLDTRPGAGLPAVVAELQTTLDSLVSAAERQAAALESRRGASWPITAAVLILTGGLAVAFYGAYTGWQTGLDRADSAEAAEVTARMRGAVTATERDAARARAETLSRDLEQTARALSTVEQEAAAATAKIDHFTQRAEDAEGQLARLIAAWELKNGINQGDTGDDTTGTPEPDK